VQRDTKRFWKLLGEVAGSIVHIASSYNRLKREYRAVYPLMVSDAAWEERFSAALKR
jgi:hypothetical protein